jgi:hypothetical protein
VKGETKTEAQPIHALPMPEYHYQVDPVASASAALTPSPTLEPTDAEVERATHRHMKRGTEYVLIGIGRMQAEGWHDPSRFNGKVYGPDVDMREVAIYRSATDPTEIWVRPREEFEDGRFEVIASRQSTSGEGV